MISRKICYCIFFNAVASLSFAELANATQNHRSGKCGRDCLYVAAVALGVEVDLESLDQWFAFDLNERDLNFAEISAAASRINLHAKAVTLEASSLPNFKALLPQRELVVITRIRRESGDFHFVLLLNSDRNGFDAYDATSRKVMRLHVTALDPDRIPLLVLTREPWVLRSEGLASSQTLTVLLGCLVILVCFPVHTVKRTIYTWAHIKHLRSISCGFAVICAGVGLAIAYQLDRSTLAAVDKIDLGSVPVGSKQRASFSIQNRSFREATVEYKVSCHCLKLFETESLLLHRFDLLPVEFEIDIERPGSQSYWIAFTTSRNRANPTLIEIIYNGVHAGKLERSSQNVGVLPMSSDTWKEVEFEVVGFDSGTVPVSDIRPSGSHRFLDVQVDAGQFLKTGNSVNLRLRPLPGVTAGSFAEKFVLATSENTPRNFVITLAGSFAPALFASPSSVVVTETSSDPIEIHVVSRTGPFRIEDVVISPELTGIALSYSQEDADSHAIKVSGLRQARRSLAAYVISFTFSDAALDKLDVPLFLFPFSLND